ncbi:MAG: sel1 repeat family protein [Pseudomonadota bacterium]|nr:sel1 repeat family protein [Pseudomonadota bacterium]
MKIITAVMLGAALLLSAAPASARDPLDDAFDLLTRDQAAGLAALERLIAADEPEAMSMVAGIIYAPPPESEVVADPVRAVALWERALELGSVSAPLNYGTRLILNDDPADDERAVEMLQGVREDFAPLAVYPLGRAYLLGHGVEPDMARGTRLMEAAVEGAPGNTDARYLLARAYQNGWGVPVDDAAAYRHMKIAADGGDPRAQWNVGMMLLSGDGVTANEGLAFGYVRASAENGEVSGMISMAVMLAVGQGTRIDAAQARQWYRRAAETGSAHALRGLAGMLLTGEGGRVDAVTGAAYLDLAAKAGDGNARQMQQIFAAQLSSLDQGAVEAAKAAWLRDYGIPR